MGVNVIGCLGHRRNGKSLLSHYLAYRAHILDHMTIFANCWTSYGEHLDMTKLISFDADMRDLGLVLEEPHNFMDSWGRDRLSRMISHWLTQIGKRNILVIWNDQFEGWLNQRLKQQTDIFAHCHTPDKGRTVDIEFEDRWGQWREAGSVVRRTMHHMERYWPIYNTGEIFSPLDTMFDIELKKQKVI